MDWFTGITYHYKYEICLDDLFVLERCLQYFSECIEFVFTALCEKDFCFHEKELGVKVWTDYYTYEICLDDIFNCFGEIFIIFFSGFIDFVFAPFMRKGLLLSRKGVRCICSGLIHGYFLSF